MTRTSLPVIRLSAASDGPNATANVQITIGGQRVRMELTVPTEPASPRALLPVFHGLTDVVVAIAAENAEREGGTISCKKGCGACCRQAVPISPSEAHALAPLVDAMPEPRRSAVRRRFTEAIDRFAAAGLSDAIRRPDEIPDQEIRQFGMAYFNIGVPCPFLEDESCSIHEHRPAACREYLVTSPAAECARPTPATIRQVPVPAPISKVIREWEAAEWLPLLLALEWSATQPAEPALKPGTVLLEEFFHKLTHGSGRADD